MGLEILRETSLNAHINSMKLRKKSGNSEQSYHSEIAPSLNTIHDYIEEHKEQLAWADSIEFSTPEFCRELGRKSALSVLTIHILQVLNIDKLP